jgi:hypothetical protein|tara:strand:+ start:1044 stop:1412 length:369 start_codon:yes stop_codon:yes gene_type:complete
MAAIGNWTVVMDDKKIIKQSGDAAGPYVIDNDEDFWNQSKFSNIWAIQYQTSNTSDEVEYRDTTPHSSYDPDTLGNFQDFIDKWDAAHLSKLQSNWDEDNVDGETEQEKITRLGARPTSYSS